MLNYIWAAMMAISVICALITGRMDALSQGILNGAQKAVELTIAMAGMMCAWTGLLKIAEKGGVTGALARILYPLIHRLFPEYTRESSAMQAISLNITANLLGLGNAATPLGIAAMKEMAGKEKSDVPSNSMVRFVVLNTASIQLIPTYIATLRSRYGSKTPFDIVPAVWMVSVLALTAGLVAERLLERKDKSG